MKLKATLLAGGLFLSFFVLQASAQSGSRSGIGIGIGNAPAGSFNIAIDTSPFASIYFPQYLSPDFRVEPELGVLRVSESDNNGTVVATVVQFGIGLFRVTRISEQARLYAGMRAGLFYYRVKIEDDFNSDSAVSSEYDLYLGPAIGGEHFFGDHFSLGAEARLLASFLALSGDSESKESVLSTGGVFFVRWYF